MRAYLRNLPHQPLAARRRFVVVATVVSFVLVVLVWAGILFLGRGRREFRGTGTASPSPGLSVGEAAAGVPALSPAPPWGERGSPGARPAPVPEGVQSSPAPRLNVEELSTDLLKVLGDGSSKRP